MEINYTIPFLTVITLFNQCYCSMMNQAGHRESESCLFSSQLSKILEWYAQTWE